MGELVTVSSTIGSVSMEGSSNEKRSIYSVSLVLFQLSFIVALKYLSLTAERGLDMSLSVGANQTISADEQDG